MHKTFYRRKLWLKLKTRVSTILTLTLTQEKTQVKHYLSFLRLRVLCNRPLDSTKTVVHACITSKLDYCNGLLYGIPDSQIGRLQRVQNTCARLICGCSKFSRITPLLRDLHWLPVRQRIVFEILLIVYKALIGQAPNYIEELVKLKLHQHTHNLRSSQDTLGDRAFACASPQTVERITIIDQ